MDLHVDISDLNDLQKFFDGLNRMDQKKIIMSSYRKAVKPLVSAARANLSGHNRSYGIYRSMGTIEDPANMALLVGSKTNTPTVKTERGRRLITKVWYAHLFESGSWKSGERHWRKGSRKSVGRMPAVHFFENAYNQTQDQIFNTTANDWFDSIVQYIRRTNKVK